MAGRPTALARWCVLALIALPSCAPGKPAPKLTRVPDDALEAFYRAMFAEHAAIARPVKLVCLSKGAYPSSPDLAPGFIARFRKDKPPVVASSRCGFDIKAFDKRSGADAIIMTAQDLGCSTARRCRISGGYLIGNLGSQSATYFVEKKGATWRVRIDGSAPMVIS